MKKVLSIVFSAALGAGLVMGSFSTANAQDEFTLEEITITAEKRETNLQDTPMSISAITGAVISELGKVNIKDILLSEPSIIVQKYPEGYFISMRGLANDLPPAMSDIVVAVYKDGVHDSRQETGFAGYFDIDRVEALRGPQGTLYGRVATAGVVNIIYKDPVLDTYEASGTLEIGNYALLRSEAVMNAPVGENFALRAAFSTTVRDGYIENGQDDNDSKAARLKIKYDPNDDMSAVLGMEYFKLGGNGQGGVTAFTSQDGGNVWVNGQPTGSYMDSHGVRYWAEFEYEMNNGILTWIPSFQRWNGEYHVYFTDPDMQETSDQQKQVSNEIRIISHDYSDVQWVAGFFYYDSEDILTNLAEDQVQGEGYMDVIFQSTAVAGFGSFTYPISDRIRLTAGGRLTDDQKEVSGYYDPPVPGFWETEWAYAESWTTLNFNFNLEYDFSDDSLLYFDVSTGHRPGNYTYGNEFKPEKLTAYEMGMKNRFLDNTLQLNLASYYYNYKDYQAMDIVFIGGLPAPQIYNGQAKLAGTEFQANWLLSKADMLNVSLAYNHAEFTDLIIGDTDYQGKPLPHSPQYSATISYEHEFPLANGGYATFHADTRYETENRIMFTGTDDTTMEPDHHISNMSLAYNSPDGKLKLSTYIKNLENHAEKTQKFGPVNTVGAPRTYGAILTVSY